MNIVLMADTSVGKNGDVLWLPDREASPLIASKKAREAAVSDLVSKTGHLKVGELKQKHAAGKELNAGEAYGQVDTGKNVGAIRKERGWESLETMQAHATK